MQKIILNLLDEFLVVNVGFKQLIEFYVVLAKDKASDKIGDNCIYRNIACGRGEI